MKKGHRSSYKPKNKDRMMDLSKQDDFLFNKTPILSSAVQKLKNKESHNKPVNRPKFSNLSNNDQSEIDNGPKKKVKKSLEEMIPSLVYTPLQKDLYNFYTINKITLKTMESIQEPKF